MYHEAAIVFTFKHFTLYSLFYISQSINIYFLWKAYKDVCVDGWNVSHVRDWQYLDGSSMNTSNGLWEQKATINDEQCVRMFAFFDYLLTDQSCKQYMYAFICEMSPFNK